MQKPSFTRGHYDQAAKLIASKRDLFPPHNQHLSLAALVTLFDELFAGHNPRFDKARFHQSIHSAFRHAEEAQNTDDLAK